MFIGVTGDKGKGKTVLSFSLWHEIMKEFGHEFDFIKDCDLILNHVIFTIDDYYGLEKRDVVKFECKGVEKVCCAVWDDFGLHTSSYEFLRGEGDKIGDFVEQFEVVREKTGILIANGATWDLIPPKIRNSPNVMIDVYERGKAKIYEKKKILWLELVWKSLKDIEFSNIPDEFYKKYRRMKDKAIKVKRYMRLIKLEEKAKGLAEKLKPEDWENEPYLIALGVKDMFGNYTLFGELVKRFWEEKNKRWMHVQTSDLKGKIIKKDYDYYIKPMDDSSREILKRLHSAGGTQISFKIIVNGNEIPEEIPADELFS